LIEKGVELNKIISISLSIFGISFLKHITTNKLKIDLLG
jgi:hypothetical protein